MSLYAKSIYKRNESFKNVFLEKIRKLVLFLQALIRIKQKSFVHQPLRDSKGNSRIIKDKKLYLFVKCTVGYKSLFE